MQSLYMQKVARHHHFLHAKKKINFIIFIVCVVHVVGYQKKEDEPYMCIHQLSHNFTFNTHTCFVQRKS